MSLSTEDETRPTGVTLADVAARSGCSVSLVSRVLSGQRHAASDTRDRILAAAHELGYDRGSQRRGRPRAVPRLLDLAMSQWDDPWANTVVSSVRRAAASSGYDLVLTPERDSMVDDWPNRIRARGSAGAIVCLIRPNVSQLDLLASANIPVVLLDPRSQPSRDIPSVGSTDWQGGYDAGRHLARRGTERFIIITGRPKYRFGRAREAGFRAAVAEHANGGTVEEVSSPWSSASAFVSMRKRLRDGGTPIGVFSCNDEMAYGVYRAADELHLRIPDDVRIVGFDDLPQSRLMPPPMTSVRQPMRGMAERAVQLVLGAASVERQLERIELPTELIVRAST
ncbi:MAG TPA: LacI family DNA-binding transcriptional regulator [Plantibacter sp.]|uniref:LacI family DNA-binding transcriptional regulator n=1 Tax=unclassified Plantibacter TaxID=2624265 RepID=UPI002CC654F9|nr:LacI family DNA-binding transcriptional regulator [Plantibacter sp.]